MSGGGGAAILDQLTLKEDKKKGDLIKVLRRQADKEISNFFISPWQGRATLCGKRLKQNNDTHFRRRCREEKRVCTGRIFEDGGGGACSPLT